MPWRAGLGHSHHLGVIRRMAVRLRVRCLAALVSAAQYSAHVRSPQPQVKGPVPSGIRAQHDGIPRRLRKPLQARDDIPPDGR